MEAFSPFYDRVVMEFVPEEKTEGGLYVPKSSQQQDAAKMKVLSVGPGKWDIERQSHLPMHVSPGQFVYVNPFLGTRVPVSRSKTLLVQREDELLGLIDTPKPEVGGG